jgi:hypothetical protein
MATYPIGGGDEQGLLEAVNYVASGPSGLGQYNVGFNKSTNAWITGNFRLPYSNTTFTRTYVAPIALSTSEWLDDLTWKYTFTTPQAVAPFTIGNNITVSGVTPSDYDGTFSRVGVVECTTTYVIARASGPYPNPGTTGTGGTVSLEVIYFDFPTTGDYITISTDCNGILSVVGPEDYVNLSAFITRQNALGISGKVVEPGSNGNFGFAVQLNRYKAFNSGTAANPQYFYEFDTTVAEQTQQLFLTGGLGQILTLSIDATSGTKVDTTPAGYFATIEAFQMTTTGTGENQAFNIDLPSSVAGAYTTANTTIAINNPGYNFVAGDKITIPGADLDGVTPTNNLVLNVVSATTLPSSISIDPTTTFTTLLDHPAPGLYWYILEFLFQPQAGGSDVVWYVTDIEAGRRSLTAQLIKK